MEVAYRFKGLNLVEQVPEELWIKVRNIVQEAVTKTIPKKKKCKTAKWFSEEALQTAEERREEKDKGERERYTQLNAELRRIARRDKKNFLNEQCKEMEENNRMGKTRDLFKKIGAFHVRMGMIKDRNGKDLHKQKRLRGGGKNAQKNYTKNGLNDPDNHDDVVTHLEMNFWSVKSGGP